LQLSQPSWYPVQQYKETGICFSVMWCWLSKALTPAANELTKMAGKTLAVTATAAQGTHEHSALYKDVGQHCPPDLHQAEHKVCSFTGSQYAQESL